MNKQSTSLPTAQDHSKSSEFWFLNPLAVLLVVLVWIAGGSLVVCLWWSANFAAKFLWAFALWAWIILSPIILSLSLCTLSIGAMFVGMIRISELLGYISTMVFRVSSTPLSWIGINLFSFPTDCYVMSLIASCKYHRAETVIRASLSEREKKCGSNDTALCGDLVSLAQTLSYIGQFNEAESCIKRSLSIKARSRKSNDYPPLHLIYYALGDIYKMALRFKDAEKSYLMAVQHCEASKVPRMESVFNISTSLYFSNLGEVYTRTGKLEEAEKCFDKAKSGYKSMATKSVTMSYLRKVGVLRVKQGRRGEAEQCIAEAVKLCEKCATGIPSEKITTLKAAALLESDKGNFARSEAMIKDALSLAERVYGLDHPEISDILDQYADLLSNQSRQDEAGNCIARSAAIKNLVEKQFSNISETEPLQP